MATLQEMKSLQALPLEMKIARSKQRINEWVRYFGTDGVYVSFSGGKDSTVLLHLVRSLYPSVEAVFVNTGLEYPEIQKFAMSFENVRVLYPKKSFKQVVRDYGYPIISKVVSHQIGVVRRCPNGAYARKLYSGLRGRFSAVKYAPLLDMDFMCSNRCCDVLKKQPVHRYAKESGKVAITAQMACESNIRMKKWLSSGCNSFDNKYPVSNPLSFWTDDDILRYIKIYSLPLCSVYGDIVYDCCDPEQMRFDDCTTLKLTTSECKRTGCIFCGFGAHLDCGLSRFQRLKITHPRLYDYCINGGMVDSVSGLWVPSDSGLGLGHVFEQLNAVYGSDFILY